MDIVARAKNILLSPNTEWPVIAAERTTVKDLYTGYIVPLTAIGPICSLIAMILFIGGAGIVFGVIGAVLTFVVNLVATYVVALIAAFLIPKFGGRTDFLGALKLVGYSYTPAWIGGVFNLIPSLALLDVLLALYGFYLLYVGATPVANVPQDRAAMFTIVLVVSVIIVFILTGFVLTALVGAGAAGMIG
jgi:hypothetical protein